MARRDNFILLVAIVSGIGAFFLVLNFLNEAGQPKKEFVIARQEIPAGKTIAAGDLSLSEPLANRAEEDLFLQVKDAIGYMATEKIGAGSLIYRSKVKIKEAVSVAPVTSLPIPEGMRALTIPAVDVTGMPDPIAVGDYVDILGYVEGANNVRELETLLLGVQVISLENPYDAAKGSITVAVSPNEVEVLVMATTLGKIRIIVRPDQGERSLYQSEVGSIEVIRGTAREKKMTA